MNFGCLNHFKQILEMYKELKLNSAELAETRHRGLARGQNWPA
jgi:hypothetical protein